MINPNVQAAKALKKAVTAAKNRRDMFWRSQAPELACMLTDALEEFEKAVQDPQIGVRALVDFYKRDAEIFERCDDSDGNVGDVFRITTADMLCNYASLCANQDEIADQILELQVDSNYGVREPLIDKLSSFLDKRGMEKVIAILEQKATGELDEINQRSWLYMIESLACQIKDGALFERTRLRSWGSLNSRAYVDIAKVYFESGDALTAYDRLQKAAELGAKDEYEYAELFREVCRVLGKTEELEKILWDIFRGHRCVETLNELIAQIGTDKRTEIIRKETDLIMAAKEFSPVNAQFLLDVEEVGCVEDYILTHNDQLDGRNYYHLVPLAEKMEVKGCFLAAAVIYRALLEGNLAKAISKYYSHGVRYLRKLDGLANQITDWRAIKPHADYVQQIKHLHERKSAFWTKYEQPQRRRLAKK